MRNSFILMAVASLFIIVSSNTLAQTFQAQGTQPVQSGKIDEALKEKMFPLVREGRKACNTAFFYRNDVPEQQTFEIRKGCYKTVEKYVYKSLTSGFEKECSQIEEAIWEYEAGLNGARSLDLTPDQFDAYMTNSAMEVGLMYNCKAIPW